MYRCDESGRLHYVNIALVRMLGYDSAEELLAQNLGRHVYVDPDDRLRLIERLRPAGIAATLDGVRMKWRTKQGRHLVVQIHGSVTIEAEGPRFDASVLDVTELDNANTLLRQQREALASTAAILDLVIRQMTGIYWIVDRDLRICRTGGAVQDLLGYPPDRYLGLTIGELRNFDTSIDPVWMHQRALAGETVTFPAQYRSKHLVTTVGPYRTNGEIVGAIATCIDVTAHHMLERRMVDAQRAESLGVLAAGLAHDFNNLLVAILGNADLALRELAPRAAGWIPLDNIRQASLRAAELTEQLLSYAGHGSVASTRVAPAPVVQELLRISAPMMPANVNVRVDIGRELALRGDASQIRQVLLNLIHNARDALAALGGTIAISGRLVRHDGMATADDVLNAAAGSYIALEIADDGPGMTGETRRRIFEPFFTTKPTGHGLGLASVLGIVRAHEGGLRLTTSPGEGARFQLLWPSTFTPPELAAVSPPSTGYTVLIIDDEDLVRDVVARMVEDLGYAAITATDGPSGLTIVDNLRIDAVLVDLTMPQTTGAAVTALRARRPDLPIILCSAGRETRALRADAYLPKPFRIDTLDHTLAKLLPR
jgi:PAS domain S-box-containing protein